MDSISISQYTDIKFDITSTNVLISTKKIASLYCVGSIDNNESGFVSKMDQCFFKLDNLFHSYHLSLIK